MKSPNETFAVLAPNLVVSGNLVSERNIHVDGTVEGDVQTVHLSNKDFFKPCSQIRFRSSLFGCSSDDLVINIGDIGNRCDLIP